MNILGIDPGQTGGWACLNQTGEILSYSSAPYDSGAWDLVQMNGVIGVVHSDTKMVIEEVGGIPGQSASAAFNFGYGVGLWRGIAAAYNMPVETVRPQEWQHQYVTAKEIKGLTKPQKKKRYVLEAQQRWPGVKFTSGTADAALIAEWYRLKGAGR